MRILLSLVEIIVGVFAGLFLALLLFQLLTGCVTVNESQTAETQFEEMIDQEESSDLTTASKRSVKEELQ